MNTSSELRKAIFQYTRDQAGAIGVLLAQLLLIAAFELAKPWPFRFVVDYVIGNENFPFAINISKPQLLFLSCLAIVVLYFLTACLRLYSSFTQLTIGNKMVYRLRNELYDHLQSLSLTFHNLQQKGELINKTVNDTQSLQQLFNRGLLPLLTIVLTIIGMIIILFRVDMVLTLTSVGILPLLLLLLRPFLSALKLKSLRMRESEGDLLNIAELGISQIKLVQAFSQEARELARFSEKSYIGLAKARTFYLYQSLYGALVSFAIGIWIALLIGVGAYQVMAGKITLGILVVFISYLTLMLLAVNTATELVGTIRSSSAGMDRVFDLLHSKESESGGTIEVNPSFLNQTIRFNNVSFSYDGINNVLSDVCLEIPHGSKVSIVGPTGSGKSTLVSLLPRFYKPCTGSITVGGVDIQNLSIDSLRNGISLVLQPPIVFPGTMLENIRYGNNSASIDEVVKAAKSAQIHSYISSLPDGYETYLGVRAEQLSEGQKQRLTIARALVRDAGLIILDEPTSAMDPETEHNVMLAFSDITNATLVIIAHRLSTVRDSDLIVVMNEGHVEQVGTYEELIANPGLFSRLHRHSLGLGV